MKCTEAGSVVLCAALAAGVTPAASAADLIGAEQAIKRIEQAMQATNAPAVTSPDARAAADLLRDVAAFAGRKDKLTPDAAAKEWLALYDRVLAVARGPVDYDALAFAMRGGQEPVHQAPHMALMEALPGPDAWDALARLAEARSPAAPERAASEAALKAFVRLLSGPSDKLDAAVAALRATLAKGGRRQRMDADYRLNALLDAMERCTRFTSPDAVARDMDRALATKADGKCRTAELRLPDLVELIGEARAQEFVLRALRTPGLRIDEVKGRRTAALARRLALEHVKDLTDPQWTLVRSPDAAGLTEAMALHEAMAKKFPRPKPQKEDDRAPSDLVQAMDASDSADSRRRCEADAFYVLGLLAQGRAADAAKMALEAVGEQTDEYQYPFERALRNAVDVAEPAALCEFYAAVLRARPDMPLWRHFVAAASAASRLDQVLAMLKERSSGSGLSSAQRERMLDLMADALLAADRPDEAVTAWQRLGRASTTGETAAVRLAQFRGRLAAGMRIMRVGELLKRPDWTDGGEQMAVAAMADIRKQAAGVAYNPCAYDPISDAMPLICALTRAGRHAEAADVAVESLATRAVMAGRPDSRALALQGLPHELVLLAWVYDRAGRHADVLALLKDAPWWNAGDLADVFHREYGEYGGHGVASLHLIAARALHAAGRDAEAAPILKALLHVSRANDNAYALLCEIAGPALIPWLDEQYDCDKFEERPLIWKAYLLLKAGKAQESERCAREALRVDPTDGETPAGDRVRGYAVLADALEAQGKKEDAALFRNVVASVRAAEEGDEFTQAGLVKRSLACYARAEKLFADAYCVQWRLAERLYATGDKAGADRHYRLAFEHMPEQFGQMASLCFGCQGVFDSEHTRSAAESVLQRLLKDAPQRPQVHFLMGQLRQAQGRSGEAYACYRQALALDPDYFDVLRKMSEMFDDVCVSLADRDAIRLRLMRLRPAPATGGFGGGYAGGNITDLKSVWRILEENQKFNRPQPERLFELTASKKQIESRPKDSREDRYERRWYGEWPAVPKPVMAVLQNEVARALTEILLGQREAEMEEFMVQ